jgi:GntR family transcriptional regulator
LIEMMKVALEPVSCADFQILIGSVDLNALKIPARRAERLGISASSRLIKIERVRQAADEPFAVEICYLSYAEFSGLVDTPLERASLFMTLQHDYGVEIAHADEEINATAADVRTAELLSLPRGARCCACASSSIRPKARPPCTSSDSTVPGGTP